MFCMMHIRQLPIKLAKIISVGLLTDLEWVCKVGRNDVNFGYLNTRSQEAIFYRIIKDNVLITYMRFL